MALPIMTAPRYPVTLPSTGEQYTMRPYLVKEEKALLMALESQDPEQISLAVRNIISACIDADIDINELAVFDIEKLFLEFRSISVGESISISGKCTECEKGTPLVIDIKDIELTNLNRDDMVIQLADDVGLTMKYPTLNVINEITHDVTSVEGVMELIIACIDTIYDTDNVYDAKDEGQTAVEEFVENLNSEQFGKIQDFFSKTPKLEYSVEFECEHCQHKNNLEIRGLQSFFI